MYVFTDEIIGTCLCMAVFSFSNISVSL